MSEAAIDVGDWLTQTIHIFRQAGIDTPSLDARLILGAVCALLPAQIFAEARRPIAPTEAARLASLRQRRLDREPVSRLLGRRAFMDFEVALTPATLDPRPDSETLVTAASSLIAERGRTGEPLKVVDLGTGSGALLVALLRIFPRAVGIGVDICSEALAVADHNARATRVDDRCSWRCGSWLTGMTGPFDLIVSNPPYIPSLHIDDLEPEVRLFDPWHALDGGEDGLACIRAIVADLPRVLAPGGWGLIEVGLGQAQAVRELFECTAARSIRTFKDMAGRDRCVAWQQQPANRD